GELEMSKLACPKCKSAEISEVGKTEQTPAGEAEPTITIYTYECLTCGDVWDEAKRESGFVKALKKSMVRKSQWVDQHLQEFKEEYTRLDDGQKKVLRQLVSDIADLQTRLDRIPANFRLRFCVCNNFSDPETGETVYNGYGELGAKYLLQAFDAWDKGEEF